MPTVVIHPHSPPSVIDATVVDAGHFFGVRGAPDLKRDDNNQIAEIRLPAKKTLALSLVTMCLSHVVGSFLGKVFCVTFGEYYLLRESWEVRL